MASNCYECENCVYIGDGGSACMEDYGKIVLEDHEPTEDFYWCNGERFEDV